MSYLITGEYLESKDVNSILLKKCDYLTNDKIKIIGKKLATEVRQANKNVIEPFATEITDAICELNTIKRKIKKILGDAKCLESGEKCISIIIGILVEYCMEIVSDKDVCDVIKTIKTIVDTIGACSGPPYECIFAVIGILCGNKDELEESIENEYCSGGCNNFSYCDIKAEQCLPKKNNGEKCDRPKVCLKTCGLVRRQDDTSKFESKCCDSTSEYISDTLTTKLCDKSLKEGDKCRYDSECESNDCSGNELGVKIGRCTAANRPHGAECYAKPGSCSSGKCGIVNNNNGKYRYECCSSTKTSSCSLSEGGLCEYCTDRVSSNSKSSWESCVLGKDFMCKNGGWCWSGYGGTCRSKRSSMNNSLSNYNSVKCDNDHMCQSGICTNYNAGGVYYCWPKKSCGGSGCYGYTNNKFARGRGCRYDDQCRSGNCSGNVYGAKNGTCS